MSLPGLLIFQPGVPRGDSLPPGVLDLPRVHPCAAGGPRGDWTHPGVLDKMQLCRPVRMVG